MSTAVAQVPEVETGAKSVLLVEDHRLMRTGLRALLNSYPELRVVGEAGDGHEAVRLASRLNPDLVLMDVEMPGLNGIEAARRIRAELPATRVLMVSMHCDRWHIAEALGAGASGYVPKDAPSEDLRTAIGEVLAGRLHLSPSVAGVAIGDYVRRIQGHETAGELDVLSPREREILQLIGEGRSGSDIARLLHISVRTVDGHRRHIMDKLNVRTIVGLTKCAIRNGLCRP
jgi:DNA-binding NarL/FixJ family response regulator